MTTVDPRIKVGKTYRTRDGREARIYATDGGGDYPVHGAVRDDLGWRPESWTATGRDCLRAENDDDLILSDAAPQPAADDGTVQAWCMTWRNEYGIVYAGPPYDTREEAESIASAYPGGIVSPIRVPAPRAAEPQAVTRWVVVTRDPHNRDWVCLGDYSERNATEMVAQYPDTRAAFRHPITISADLKPGEVRE